MKNINLDTLINVETALLILMAIGLFTWAFVIC